MNSGSKVRGQADGFHLSLLPQLMDVKATQATPTSAQAPSTATTLLQFIVSYFVKHKVSCHPSLQYKHLLYILIITTWRLNCNNVM